MGIHSDLHAVVERCEHCAAELAGGRTERAMHEGVVILLVLCSSCGEASALPWEDEEEWT